LPNSAAVGTDSRVVELIISSRRQLERVRKERKSKEEERK